MRTFNALSLLLSYPSEELVDLLPAITGVLQDEGVLAQVALDSLSPLLMDLAAADLYDLQERYVLLFDRSRTLSLNLFEHIHGESRDRGGAMVDLLETYRAGGYDLASAELPDHLPVLLEYLSTRPLDEAQALLAEAGHILAALADRLNKRGSDYAAVLTALVTLGGASLAGSAELAEVEPDDPEDLAALDAVWTEAQVTFGPDPNAGCPVSRDILARMDAQSANQAAAQRSQR